MAAADQTSHQSIQLQHGHGAKHHSAFSHHAPHHHSAPAYHRPAPVYHKPAPVPAYKPAPLPAYKPAPAYKPDHYDETPQPYAFQYGVKDDYSQANFNAQESADGKLIFFSDDFQRIAILNLIGQKATYMYIFHKTKDNRKKNINNIKYVEN